MDRRLQTVERETRLGNPGDQGRVYFPQQLLMHFSPFYHPEIHGDDGGDPPCES